MQSSPLELASVSPVRLASVSLVGLASVSPVELASSSPGGVGSPLPDMAKNRKTGEEITVANAKKAGKKMAASE